MSEATVEWVVGQKRGVLYKDLKQGEWFTWETAGEPLLKVTTGYSSMRGFQYEDGSWTSDKVIRIRVNIQCEEE